MSDKCKTDAYYEELDKQYLEEEAARKIRNAQIQVAAKEWREKWPNACAVCRGAVCRGEGGRYYPGNYWNPPEFEACIRLQDDENLTCCRCGQPNAFTDDLEGPCKHCGWNFDDAEPSFE